MIDPHKNLQLVSASVEKISSGPCSYQECCRIRNTYHNILIGAMLTYLTQAQVESCIDSAEYSTRLMEAKAVQA